MQLHGDSNRKVFTYFLDYDSDEINYYLRNLVYEDSIFFGGIYDDQLINVEDIVSILPDNLFEDDLQYALFSIYDEAKTIDAFVHDEPGDFLWFTRSHIMKLKYIYTNPQFEYGFFLLNDNKRGLEFIQADYDIYSRDLNYITHCISFKDYDDRFIELPKKKSSKAKIIKRLQKSLKEPLESNQIIFQLGSNGIQDSTGECEVLVAGGLDKLPFYVEKIPTNKISRDIITDQAQLSSWHVSFT